MSSKHTPGPWRAFSEAGCEAVVNADDELVADCMIVGRGRNASTNRANARLIAAAPELLAAGKLVLESAQSLDPEMTAAYAAMRAAISAAESQP